VPALSGKLEEASCLLCVDFRTDKADTVKASFYQKLEADSAVAVELAHKISKKDITFTAGGSYKIDKLTESKVRVNNRGMVAALLEHPSSGLSPRSHSPPRSTPRRSRRAASWEWCWPSKYRLPQLLLLVLYSSQDHDSLSELPVWCCSRTSSSS